MATDKKARLRSLMAAHTETTRVPKVKRRERSSEQGPLSSAQRSIWYAAQLEAPDSAYNNSIIIRMSGALDIEALNRALSLLLQRHESLRTRVVEFEGVPSQFCEEAEEMRLEPQWVNAAEAESIFLAEARHPFLIEVDWLFRVKLYQELDERFVLVVSMHHLISDAWSMGLFIREMVALYDAYTSGRETSLNALPVTYLDYVYWERDWLDSGVLERQLEYWRLQLKDLSQPPMVPQSSPHISSQSTRGGMVEFAVPLGLLQRLRSLSHDHNCSIFVTLLAGFAVVLHRYSLESDIAIGTGVSNRRSAELEGLIGCFVNTLVLRLALPSDQSFTSVLKTAREVFLQALTHQDAPYQRVIEQLLQERAGDSRLFQAIFTFQNVEWQQRIQLPSLTMEVELPSIGAAKFDLFISVQEWPEGLRGQIEYRCDLFEEATVRRLADHYVRSLHRITEYPEMKIGQIGILGPEERHQLLEEWNHTGHGAEQASVAKLFEGQVETSPDRTAVVFEDKALSYRELNRRANQLAHYLRGLGVQPDSRVAICMERDLGMMVGLLGVLKAGGAYVPLDPKYPMERLRYMFEDSAPAVVLTQSHLQGMLKAISKAVPVVDLTAPEPEWQEHPDMNPQDVRIGLTPEHLAYVIYTSGSSGLPKGVEVSHHGIWDLVRSQIRAFGIGSEDRVLQFASMNFDASVPEIFTAWLTGGSLHLAAQEQLLPGQPLGGLLKEREITVLTLPPSLLGYLKKEDAVSVRVLIVAGEACTQELVKEWAVGRRMFNAYGPTEVTVCATIGECEVGDGVVHIGRPIEGSSVYLLDRHMQPLPQGVTGEIYVGGAGVARGYVNRPELTAERFFCDPFTRTPGARMYKTGDLGRWRADGTIEFQGRNDWQVKVRGHRIELGEIEACLRRHPGVRQAVVAAHEEAAEDKRLVAYVVPRPVQGVEMWPSVAEHYIYDDLLYYAMINDQRRNDAYRAGMKNLKGAVVLEIGTGPEALLARLCIEAGARKVYAIELLQHSYDKACARVAELGLQDKIEVIHGDATKVRLPESVDVCVSEIVGPIGGAEGAAQIHNGVRHLLKPEAQVIPRRSITRMAAVRLPEAFVQQPAFSKIGASYAEKIFSAVGYRFDVRVCLKGIGYDDLVSDWGVFEDLDYTQEIQSETEHDVVLTVNREGVVHGLLVWLTLEVGEGEWLDILAHEHCWIPVYLPVFNEGIEMRARDPIQIRLRRSRSENELNPDFHITARAGKQEFLYNSPHVQRKYKSVPFYERLWSGDETPVCPTDFLDKPDLLTHLRANLPEYMIPTVVVDLAELPLTPNGKVDRRALLMLEESLGSASGYDPPQGEIETTLAALWMEVLKCDRVGRHDNFFALGGHSLLAVTLVERMHRHNFKMDVYALFVTPTLAELAATLGITASAIEIPPNRIPAGCEFITPEMLPLVKLTQEEIDRIVAAVPGGAGNVQDIYPLAPLQEGILFHHLMGGEGDPYVVASMFSFDSVARLESYMEALQGVIDRHDILRTAVLWEGFSEPVQAVWRRAPLPIEEIEVHLAAGDASEQLYERFNPRRFRIDVRQAPMLRLYTARDRAKERWLLMILMHHLAGDHTTLEVMQMEVRAHLLGQQASLPPAIPLRNMVVQARLGVSQEEHEAFFRKMLGDVDEPTAPFGLLEVKGDGIGIEQAELPLDEDLARRLRGQARRLGVSAASLCHVAWARVLSKVAGREDVVFGTVLFGRTQGWEGADRVMGLFINTLPVRLSAGEEGVENAVRNTQLLLAELMHHEHASLALAQRCSAVPARTPLFSSLFNYRYSAGVMLESFRQAGPAWEGIRLVRSEQRTNYPLILSVDDLGEGISLETQSQGSIGSLRICVYMRTALESLVQALELAPETELRLIEVLPPSERRQLIEQWNASESQYPREKCVHHLFEHQVERMPEAVALVFEDQSVSYEELNRRANQLAHYLCKSGVRPEARVGICVERGLEMVVGILGVMKAGAAYVPLDPEYPGERLRFMVEDSESAALLTQGKFLELFPATEESYPVIDLREGGLWMNQPETNPELGSLGLTSEHPAYVIYTSGSTGRPKGVSMPHRSLVNLLWWQIHRTGKSSPKRTLQFAAIGFDVAFQEIFLTLCSGGVLVLIDERKKRNFAELVHFIDATGVQRLFLPYVALQMLAESLNEMHGSGGGRRFGCALSEIITAGEQLRIDPKIAGMFELLQDCTLENQYGPTEAHVVTSFTLPGDTSRWTLLPPIGRPIANTRTYILDQCLEPVPVGVAGELYLGGDQLARGYFKRPDLTAERFVKDLFVAEAGGRMYKTGDQAKWLADGTIEFLGRNDFQVKIRGFRIELGEIEARLEEHPGVAESVVMAEESASGEKRLVAYYTSAEQKRRGVSPNLVRAEQLRACLSARLPDYMVPAAYVLLEKMPMTPNGKLDRQALPSPGGDAYGLRGYEAPVGETETILAAMWRELLKAERVGRHDSFFDLGGHSLLAMRVVSRVRQVLGVEVALSDLFAHPKISLLADRITEMQLAQFDPEEMARLEKQMRSS